MHVDTRQHLLARELGNDLAAGLGLHVNSHLNHGLQKAFTISFENAHLTGVNALDIVDIVRSQTPKRLLLSGGLNGEIALWDFLSPSVKGLYKPYAHATHGHNYGITSVSFYPDAKCFFTSSYDQTVNVWRTEGMIVEETYNLDAPVYCAKLSPSASHALLAVGSQSPTIRLLDVMSGSATHSLVGHTDGGTLALNWSPRNPFILASGGQDGAVRLWDIRKASTSLATLDMNRNRLSVGSERAHNGPVNGLTWTEDGASLVTFGHDNKLRVWNLDVGANAFTEFGSMIHNRSHHTINPILAPLRQCAPSVVFVPSSPDTILGFNVVDGCMIMKQRTNRNSKINCLIQIPGEAGLLSGAADGTIDVFLPWTSCEGEIRKNPHTVL